MTRFKQAGAMLGAVVVVLVLVACGAAPIRTNAPEGQDYHGGGIGLGGGYC